MVVVRIRSRAHAERHVGCWYFVKLELTWLVDGLVGRLA